MKRKYHRLERLKIKEDSNELNNEIKSLKQEIVSKREEQYRYERIIDQLDHKIKHYHCLQKKQNLLISFEELRGKIKDTRQEIEEARKKDKLEQEGLAICIEYTKGEINEMQSKVAESQVI